MTTSFTGYPGTALRLLAGIGDNDKSWFDRHKPEYESELAAPTKALVTDLGDLLRDSVSPAIQAVPRVHGSISPINNDLRFHQGAPYKNYILLRFWEGPEKKSAPTLFLRISPDGIGVGSGISLAGPEVSNWREAVAGPAGEELVEALRPVLRKRDAVIAGEELKRVPAGYDSDSPRADLLRHRWFQVRWQEPVPAGITSPRFVTWCGRRLVELGEVHCWLRDHV